MPPPQIFSLDGHPYGLTVAGVQLIEHVPIDIAPIRWTVAGKGVTGGMSFTVEDAGEVSIADGHVVRLTDNVTNELLSSGVLVNRRGRRGVGALAYVECEVAGWGYFLDHRTMPDYDFVQPAWPGTTYAREILYDIIGNHGGPIKTTPALVSGSNPYQGGGTVARSVLTSSGSVRSAVDAVVEWIYSRTSYTPSPPLHYYVDEDAMLHLYEGTESTAIVGAPPCRIGDGSYISDVMGNGDIVEYWPDVTMPGVVAGVAFAYASPPSSSGQDRQAVGVLNEPGIVAQLFSDDPGTAVASLPGAADFSIECWFRTAGSTATQYLWGGQSPTSPTIAMSTAGVLTLQTNGGTVEALGTASWDDDAWHHVVAIHDAGVGGTVYVDGGADNAGSTAQTFGAPGTAYIGEDFAGYLQHAAVYDAVLGTATIAAHREQGITYAPDSLSVERASDGVVHMLWSTTAGGTAIGWVSQSAPYWDAGQTSESFTGVSTLESAADNLLGTQSQARLALAGKERVDVASFSLMDISGWRPGQAVEIQDTRLTEGTALSLVIADVNGEMNPGGHITYTITAGATPRSIVQTVSGL